MGTLDQKISSTSTSTGNYEPASGGIYHWEEWMYVDDFVLQGRGRRGEGMYNYSSCF